MQIHVNDEGATRLVSLVPVGSSTLARSFAGLKNTVSKSASREKVQTVVAAFRAADPVLVLV